MTNRTLHLLTVAAVLWIGTGRASAQPAAPMCAEDSAACLRVFREASENRWNAKPIGDIVIAVGTSFLGTDYVANSLEEPGPEHLVVNLRGFDCVTFYENSLALARCIRKNTMTVDAYRKELTFLRYRNGTIDGYASRLHYTSDYFFGNSRKGILQDVTKEIGGVPFVKTINFMSTHAGSYAALKRDSTLVPRIAALEAEITRREKFYLPKRALAETAGKIQSGDIIGITTNIDGMDVAHTGIAIWKGGALHFLHAPITGAKVQVTDVPLSEYLARIKKDTGIMVARPLDPLAAR